MDNQLEWGSVGNRIVIVISAGLLLLSASGIATRSIRRPEGQRNEIRMGLSLGDEPRMSVTQTRTPEPAKTQK